MNLDGRYCMIQSSLLCLNETKHSTCRVITSSLAVTRSFQGVWKVICGNDCHSLTVNFGLHTWHSRMPLLPFSTIVIFRLYRPSFLVLCLSHLLLSSSTYLGLYLEGSSFSGESQTALSTASSPQQTKEAFLYPAVYNPPPTLPNTHTHTFGCCLNLKPLHFYRGWTPIGPSLALSPG